MTDVAKLIAETRELDAKATEGPWSDDDGNVFSVPLSERREAAILRRMKGSDEPHPDGDWNNPLGWVCGTEQSTERFESDSRLIARYRTLAPQLADALERVEDRLEYTQQWYAERCERLWHWAHEDKEHRSGYFAIMANGTETIHEPPTYAQQMNTLRHALERSEDTAQRQAAEIVIGMRENNRLKAENARLREALAAVCDALDVRLGDSDLDGDGSAEFRAFSNARDLLAKTEVDDG